VLFSCKISSSILTYLERHGEDLTPLLESTPLPEEFLKDPSYWMPAKDMEKFLSSTAQLGPRLREPNENLLVSIGHATPDLRSWGVFDSVLRMMSLHDVLAKPSRFLSYFISPEPPVDNLVRTENSMALDLPVPADQFPNSTTYLRACFESLPVFSGKPLGHCSWNGIRLQIAWEARQNDIFTDSDPGHQISPELMRDIVAQLEKHQLELQYKNAELEERNEQLRRAYRELEEDMRKKLSLQEVENSASKAGPIKIFDPIDISSLVVLKDQVSRMGDYMVRAQQLMTMLIGQDRLNPAVQEAMKRVDWERVKKQFPLTMSSCFEILNASAQAKLQGSQPENKNENITPLDRRKHV
jgi:hypothetical protein